MAWEEHSQGDGTVQVQGFGTTLKCPVCGEIRFHERNSLLNTRLATFFNFDWANKEARNYICATCGYVFWFLTE